MEPCSVVLHLASLAVAPGDSMSRWLGKLVPDKVKKRSSRFGEAITEEEKEGEGESARFGGVITADSDAREPGSIAVQPTMMRPASVRCY